MTEVSVQGEILTLPWEAKTPAAKTAAKQAMMARIPWEGVAIPIPAILTLLPWAVDGDDAIDDIVGNILTADSLESPRGGSAPMSAKDCIGRFVTVHDIGMRPGEKDGAYRCYVSMDCTNPQEEDHYVINTGAPGILMFLARAYLTGSLPITVVIEEVQTSNKAHSNPLYLREVKTF